MAKPSVASDTPARTPGTVAESALEAVSRLLAAGLDEDGPPAVHEALVREARGTLAAPFAALLATGPDGRHAELLAREPGAPPLAAEVPLAELVEEARPDGGDQTRILRGRPAARVAAVLGAEGLPDASAGLVCPLRGLTPAHALVVLSDRPLGAPDRGAAEALARAAAASLAQLSLTDEHAARGAQQAALARAAKRLNQSLDPSEVVVQICREAAGILAADLAGVYLGDAERGLRLEATYNLPPEAVGYELAAGAGLAGKVAQFDRPMLTNDYKSVSEPELESPLHDVRCALAVPMHWDGALRGVLSVSFRTPRTLSGDHLRLLEAFAELAAVACRNASAHAGLALAARTDALTGCLNHAALQEGLRREIERSRRGGHRLSLVLLDLDDFKGINEQHGHLVGDEVLRRVGHSLRQSLRPYDLVARYGGDEFAIVTVDATEDEAVEIAERALARLAEAIEDVGPGAGLATAGVAEWSDPGSSTELIYDADRALLHGKRDGGTIVVPASTLPSEFRPGRFRRQSAALPPVVANAPAWPQDRRDSTERLRKRTRQLALANALGTRLSAMTDPTEILDATVQELHRAFGYYIVAAMRLGDDDQVRILAGRGYPFVSGEGPWEWRQHRDLGVIGRCLIERRPVVVNDVREDSEYTHDQDTVGTRAELVVPLWVGDRLWGVIDLQENEIGAFDEDDVRLIQTVADQSGSALRSAFLYEQLERAYLGTAEALATALEAKDSYTAHHARSIAEAAVAVGRRLGMTDVELRDLRYGAIFHDIGKIAMPEEILNKRGPLDEAERAIVARHTVVGEQILAPIEFLAGVRPLVRHEHERWDGAGYPDGLSGEDIPLGARVILACDAYHAMTSDRPYRAALTPGQARDELRNGAGKQFDPRVVDTLLAVLADEEAAVRALMTGTPARRL